MRDASFQERRWSRKDYGRLIEVGLLREDDKIELLAGRLVVAEPQNTPHAKAIELTAEALRAAFGPGWRIRVQLPVALDPDSEPEPDVSVVAGSPRDDLDDHPANPVLIVEVADWSVRLDRRIKAPLYARGGIADYWIVNLVDRTVEVYRAPQREGRSWRYRSIEKFGPEATVRPLAAPTARITVTDLLP
ncbi:MAG: Uma2 family endonuclease [Candidatus Rokubacteria bacterium]|nr:Uma2 family endonuclease [Candidatus Rokubacteria bacterium]MBI4592770.1 Uma2 family endonuclease [Candidatus Rokubacteria bacterium]